MAITKKQKYIDDHYKFNFTLSDKQIDKTMRPMAFFNGANTICLECGEKTLGKAKKCQKCGARFEAIEETKKRTFVRYRYYDIIKKFENYLVQECYQVIKTYKDKKVSKSSQLVWVKFIDEKGKTELITLKTTFHYYSWKWDFNSDYSWYKPHFSYTYFEKYEGYSKYHEIKSMPDFMKHSRLKEAYKVLGIDLQDYVKGYLKSKVNFETFIEIGETRVLKELLHYNIDSIDEFSKPIFKVCAKPYKGFKNYFEYIGYDKLNVYFDYIKECKTLNYDIMQEHISSPESLEKAHEKTSKKISFLKNEAEINKSEKNYQKRIKKYLGIDLGNERYKIEILPTVKSFFDEGNAMHHCVFSMKYYSKANSLIFSVKNRDTNERIETTEILIDKRKINQCYGKFNKSTPFHDDILNVINKNMSKLWKGE